MYLFLTKFCSIPLSIMLSGFLVAAFGIQKLYVNVYTVIDSKGKAKS